MKVHDKSHASEFVILTSAAFGFFLVSCNSPSAYNLF